LLLFATTNGIGCFENTTLQSTHEVAKTELKSQLNKIRALERGNAAIVDKLGISCLKASTIHSPSAQLFLALSPFSIYPTVSCSSPFSINPTGTLSPDWYTERRLVHLAPTGTLSPGWYTQRKSYFLSTSMVHIVLQLPTLPQTIYTYLKLSTPTSNTPQQSERFILFSTGTEQSRHELAKAIGGQDTQVTRAEVSSISDKLTLARDELTLARDELVDSKEHNLALEHQLETVKHALSELRQERTCLNTRVSDRTCPNALDD
jgi:hypothetical protein